MVRITIIIPIYNAESYLKQCLESIRCQTLKELEIICVDDGSTDHSMQIVEQFSAVDIRICLIQQKNQGAGVARNRALEKAQGKYVAFLDADDYYIDNNALELMFDTCEKNALSACAGLRKYLAEGSDEPQPSIQDMATNKILDYQNYQIDYDYQNFIFLREIIIKNGIYFPEYRRFQDPPFLVRILYEAKQFMVVEAYLYCYRIFEPIIRFNSKNTYDLLCGLIDNLRFATEHDLDILFQRTVYRLEYEYRDIILKNIEPENLEILNLLMEANQIICHQKANPEYIIKPLRMILLYINHYEIKLLKRIREKDGIALYGAGRYGKAFLKFLKRNHLLEKVLCFVVSDLNRNERCIENIPVVTLHDLQENEEIPVFVTVREELQSEIKKFLNENHYYQYEMVKDEFLYATANEMFE